MQKVWVHTTINSQKNALVIRSMKKMTRTYPLVYTNYSKQRRTILQICWPLGKYSARVREGRRAVLLPCSLVCSTAGSASSLAKTRLEVEINRTSTIKNLFNISAKIFRIENSLWPAKLHSCSFFRHFWFPRGCFVKFPCFSAKFLWNVPLVIWQTEIHHRITLITFYFPSLLTDGEEALTFKSGISTLFYSPLCYSNKI